MKPRYALSLSHEGISLLRSSAGGGWRRLDQVAPETPDLQQALVGLGDLIQADTPAERFVKLILPNEHIRYLTVETGDCSHDIRMDLVRHALVGATPYDVADLVYDISADGPVTHAAAVARETLEEAESFAVDHGFEPACFVAMPGDLPFLGEPCFGLTEHANAHLPDGENIELDGIAVVITGDGTQTHPSPEDVDVDKATLPDESPPDETDAVPVAPPEPDIPEVTETPGFSSYRAAPAVPETPAPRSEPPLVGPATAPAAAPAPLTEEPSPSTLAARLAAEDRPEVIPAPALPYTPPKDADEATRLTVFGARENKQKPRYLGLILTGLLVVGLFLVGIWSALTPDAPTIDPVAVAPAPIQVETPQVADLADDNDPANADAPEPTEPPAQLDPPETTQFDGDQARYAATGIWPSAPQEPQAPGLVTLDDMYLTSIDRTDLAQDAFALPDLSALDTDRAPAAISSPPAPDTSFDLDEQGLVRATRDGALSPDGIMVYLGLPPVVPPGQRPVRDLGPVEVDETQPQFPRTRPRSRPDDLSERTERTQLGGRTRSELAAVRPKLRPESEKQTAEAAETAPTKLAVAQSRPPRTRPKSVELKARQSRTPKPGVAASTAAVQTAARTPAPKPKPQAAPRKVAAPATVSPRIPSSTSVARAATMKNAINLRKINLIGVYGTPSNRRALVRLPSGRYKKVKVGDRVDGGRVVAIGDSQLQYQKGGRNQTLKMPNG